MFLAKTSPLPDPEDLNKWETEKKRRIEFFHKLLNLEKISSPQVKTKEIYSGKFDGYTLSKINIIESDITISLITQNRLKKAPLVLFLHGKGGSAQQSIETCSASFLANGLNSAFIDLRGHGERSEDIEKAAKITLLFGLPMMGLILADILNVIKVLSCMGNEKLGITGVSMGGRYAFLAACSAPEIKACCCIISVTTMRSMLLEKQLLNGLHNYLPGMMNYFDYDDLIPAIAPRPMLMINGLYDKSVPLSGRDNCYHRAEEIYSLYKTPHNIEKREFNSAHELTAEILQTTSKWFQEKLD
ncbi:MAG: alpha/beta fold hydrolase [Victivallales bacterium]|nr:alpha/beta fold hydrolase [Victivallales bacterium]